MISTFTRQRNFIIVHEQSKNVAGWVTGEINGANWTPATRFWKPFDIHLDPMGHLYVTDQQNHAIHLFSPGETNSISIVGITGRLNGTTGLVPHSPPNLQVADCWNHQVKKFMRY